jgi:HD-GYP domain-containing protein (c-di-GMP phosphodiesterase class II)
MIADRPYRAGMDPETAREELERCAGTQFDSGVLAAFLRALDAAGDGENATDFPHRSPEPARPAAVMAQPA